MTHVKISSGQALSLLFLYSVFNVMNYVPAFYQVNDAAATLIANLICIVIKLILILPFLLLMKKYKNQDMFSICYNKSKWIAFIIAIIYAGILFFDIVGNTFSFSFFMVNIVYPSASSIIIIAILLSSCLLCAHYGLEGLARASTVISVLFLIGLFSIFLFSFPAINVLNIRPILENPSKTIFTAIAENLVHSSNLIMLLFLIPTTKKHQKGLSIATIFISSLFFEVVNFFTVSVLGEYSYEQTFPFFTLASLSETPIFQRLDAIHMLLWIFVTFFRITTSMIVLKHCISIFIPEKISKYLLLPLMLVSGTISFYFSTHPELFTADRTFFALIIIFVVTIIPLLIYLLPSKRKRDSYET